jgi:MGT family glycosyltransferase
MTARPSIAFFDIPYHSRLSTTVPIVRALVERGHPVYGFTLEPYRGLLEDAGAQVIVQPSFGPKPADYTVNWRAIHYSMHAVPAIVDAIRALRPAVVVTTAKCLWAVIAAEICGLRTAVIHTNALMPRGARVSEAVYAARWPGKTDGELARIEERDRAAWASCVDKFAVSRTHTEDVLPGLPNCMNLRGDINVVYTSDELQPRRAELDSTYHFVGPCYDERRADKDPELEAALDALPRPLIYASLGSMQMYFERREVFQTVLDALGDGRYGAVVAAGSADVADTLAPLPNALIRPYVPQLAVLDRASLFITHAGTNSVYESLLASVPMLMLPQGGDQPIVAESIELAGLGHWLRDPATLTSVDLRRQIDALLGDRAMKARVQAAGDSLRRAGGVNRAALLLSELAEGRGAA